MLTRTHPGAVLTAILLSLALPMTARAAPVVEIVSPVSGATVCGTVTVSAAASDPLGVAGVRFEYDGAPLGTEDTNVPYGRFAHTNNVADGVYTLTAIARNSLGQQATSAPVTVTVDNAAPYCSPKFIPTFLVYYGAGKAFVVNDEQKLAKFDLINTDRFRHDQIGGDTWGAVKGVNPNTRIYLYEMGPETANFMESTPAVSLNNISRYDNDRNHSMDSLNGNHPELFLLDSLGIRIYNSAYSQPPLNRFWHLLDFGSPAYHAYWLEAVQADVVNTDWGADGIHADNCLAVNSIFSPYSATPTAYPDDSSWSSAMSVFESAITGGLHSIGQKLWCNRGGAFTRTPQGRDAWVAMDGGSTPPDVVGEEGAFAVRWGGGVTQFFPENEWDMQAQTLSAIMNSKIAVFAHTKLSPGGVGTDNWGNSVTFWDSLWYAMGSFLLIKQDSPNNAYFYFDYDRVEPPTCSYCQVAYFDEYDMINLGKALGSFAIVPGTSVRWREFERGYVYVNPTTQTATVQLQPSCTSCRERTHANLYTPSSQLPVVTSVQLNGHRAAIVLKN